MTEVLHYDFVLHPPFFPWVFDKSWHWNIGRLKNGAHVEWDRLLLDGIDDYLYVPNSSSLQLDSAFTAEITVSMDNLKEGQRIYDCEEYKVRGFHIGIAQTSNRLYVRVNGDGKFANMTVDNFFDNGEKTKVGLGYSNAENVLKLRKNGRDVREISVGLAMGKVTIPYNIGRGVKHEKSFADMTVHQVKLYDSFRY